MAEQAQNSSWGGAVEIGALCRGLDVRGWLSTDTGELHVFNPDRTSGFFALRYKVSDQHTWPKGILLNRSFGTATRPWVARLRLLTSFALGGEACLLTVTQA